LFPDIFVNFCLQFRWPQWLLVWQSISYTTFSEFLYLDFYTLISFQFPFVLHSSSSSSSSYYYIYFFLVLTL
jgi:hypothetical protein